MHLEQVLPKLAPLELLPVLILVPPLGQLVIPSTIIPLNVLPVITVVHHRAFIIFILPPLEQTIVVEASSIVMELLIVIAAKIDPYLSSYQRFFIQDQKSGT